MGKEHYLAIDVGATKTLFAVFDAAGMVLCECKIKTNPDYERFKADIAAELKKGLPGFKFSHACCAVPGTIDFDKGVALAFGNENWRNVPIRHDLASSMPGTKLMIHNDAKLAGLSEAILLQGKYKRVLYLTVSTGIGGGVITDDKIDPDFANFEPGQMLFEYEGKRLQWEDFASGRVLSERYGKLAADIKDEKVWREYTSLLVIGLEDLLATIRPDAVVFGGGVGAHFEKFKKYLEEGLKKIDNPLVPTPPLLKAQRPEEAVIYGCYDYIKQNL